MKGNCVNLIRRCFSRNVEVTPKICVVGSGPAGFYATQHLVKLIPNVHVDIYERLPVPFGLVRFGVAPDHPDVKNVINTFNKTAEKKNVQFLGNIDIGKDVTIKQLKKAYHVVLLTYGADEDKKLAIPGEDLPNVISARKIVGWYNGTPWDKDLEIDLSGSTAAILGQGNVAVDVARILLTPIDELRKTDITQHALEKLADSKIKKVHLIGRRGPLQAAFTIKELREMLKLQDCKTGWNKSDFEGVLEIIPTLQRPRKRIAELMLKSVLEKNSTGGNEFNVIFHRSPLKFLGFKKLEGVKLGVNKLEGKELLSRKAVLTSESEVLDCTLGITSIGYKSVQVDKDIPFENKQGIVRNDNFKIDSGFYASGWLATGPTGVILTTMSNAFGTAEVIARDVQNEKLLNESKSGYDYISTILKKKNVQVVEWKDWLKIDLYEKREGERAGKIREKIVDISKMLKIAS